MKKTICLLMAGVMTASMLAGCSNNKDSGDKDVSTTYRAEYKNAVHDYIPFVEITVDADKKITGVNYDWMQADDHSKLKSQDEEYKATWEKVNPDMNQNIARETLAERLMDSQDIGKVDTVAGASMASAEFKDMVEKLMKDRVSKGNKKTLVIDNKVES